MITEVKQVKDLANDIWYDYSTVYCRCYAEVGWCAWCHIPRSGDTFSDAVACYRLAGVCIGVDVDSYQFYNDAQEWALLTLRR